MTLMSLLPTGFTKALKLSVVDGADVCLAEQLGVDARVQFPAKGFLRRHQQFGGIHRFYAHLNSNGKRENPFS